MAQDAGFLPLCGIPRWSLMCVNSAWLQPVCCRYLESKPVDGGISVSASKQVSNICVKKYTYYMLEFPGIWDIWELKVYYVYYFITFRMEQCKSNHMDERSMVLKSHQHIYFIGNSNGVNEYNLRWCNLFRIVQLSSRILQVTLWNGSSILNSKRKTVLRFSLPQL